MQELWTTQYFIENVFSIFDILHLINIIKKGIFDLFESVLIILKFLKMPLLYKVLRELYTKFQNSNSHCCWEL